MCRICDSARGMERPPVRYCLRVLILELCDRTVKDQLSPRCQKEVFRTQQEVNLAF